MQKLWCAYRKKVSYSTTENETKSSYTGLIVVLVIIAILLILTFPSKQEESPVAPTEEIQPQTDSWYATHTPLPVPKTGIMERKSKKGMLHLRFIQALQQEIIL